MNDPDRRHTSDGFDHDAMFADIVAHWNEAAPEPQTARPPHVESTDDESVHDESVHDESVHDESVHDESVHDESVHDEVHDESVVDRATDADAFDVKALDVEVFDAGAVDLGPSHDEPATPPDPSPAQAIPAPRAWRAHEVDDEYEEHFEPPPTAPLPVGDLQFWGIIAGMGGGPLLLLYLVLFNREAGSHWMLTAIAMSVGGFALLVARLPRDHEDDGDNGARL